MAITRRELFRVESNLFGGFKASDSESGLSSFGFTRKEALKELALKLAVRVQKRVPPGDDVLRTLKKRFVAGDLDRSELLNHLIALRFSVIEMLAILDGFDEAKARAKRIVTGIQR